MQIINSTQASQAYVLGQKKVFALGKAFLLFFIHLLPDFL